MAQSFSDTLRTTDVFAAACLLRDHLQKIEERCKSSQEKGQRLKQTRLELLEVLNLFEVIEENEKNRTKELQHEFETAQEHHLRTLWPVIPLGNTPDLNLLPGNSSRDSVIHNEFPSTVASDFERPFGQRGTMQQSFYSLRDNVTGGWASLLGASTGQTEETRRAEASTARNEMPSRWKERASSFLSETRATLSRASSAYQEIRNAAEEKDKDKVEEPEQPEPSELETASESSKSRIFQLVTGVKVNVSSTIDRTQYRSAKKAIGLAKPKYIGGSALQKTMPHKARRLSVRKSVKSPKGRVLPKRTVKPMDISSPIAMGGLPVGDVASGFAVIVNGAGCSKGLLGVSQSEPNLAPFGLEN